MNIADMDVGRAKVQGTAVMLIAPTAAVPDEVVDRPPRRARDHLRRPPRRLTAVRFVVCSIAAVG